MARRCSARPDRGKAWPTRGSTAIRTMPVLRVLHGAGYRGWVALEPFDYQPEPLTCAAASAAYVRGIWEAIT